MLLASTAVLGVSPPALIDDYVSVDSGASMRALGAIEDRIWAYLPDAASFPAPQGGPPVRVRMSIIVNQKLLAEPRVVGRSWATRRAVWVPRPIRQRCRAFRTRKPMSS